MRKTAGLTWQLTRGMTEEFNLACPMIGELFRTLTESSIKVTLPRESCFPAAVDLAE